MNPAGPQKPGAEDLSSRQESLLAECRRMLEAWEQVERSRRSLSAKLFDAGQNQEEVRDLLDQAERQSDRLLSATGELLSRLKSL